MNNKNKVSVSLEERSFEKYIIDYLDSKQLSTFKKTIHFLFAVLPDNSLVSITKKIKNNYNKPSYVEDILLEYYDKYNISLRVPLPLKKKIKRKKELSCSVNDRVKKFRSNTKKVPFQCLISKDLKTSLDIIKKNKNFTYEQLLKYLVS